jgi:transcriptional regulator with XRE-family HTH domain
MVSQGAAKLNELLAPKPALGFNASELARRLGVTRQAVTGWLKGKNLPSPELMARLEDLAGIPMRAWTEPAQNDGA